MSQERSARHTHPSAPARPVLFLRSRSNLFPNLCAAHQYKTDPRLDPCELKLMTVGVALVRRQGATTRRVDDDRIQLEIVRRIRRI